MENSQVVWSSQSITFIDAWKLTYQMVKVNNEKKLFSREDLLKNSQKTCFLPFLYLSGYTMGALR